MAMDILQGMKGRHFSFDGRACVFAGLIPPGRCMFQDGSGWMLEVPDPVTGLPVWPMIDQIRVLMSEKRLILRSDPLDDPVRQRGRRLERTRQELVEAKQRADPLKRRDTWFELREAVIRKWDDGNECALSKAAVSQWFATHFDIAEMTEKYGRIPSDRTFRTWIHLRGVPRDRRPADFASESGIAARRRRIDPIVLGIIKHYALLAQLKMRPNVSAFFRKANDDVKRYNAGEKLEMLDFKEALAKPPRARKMCALRIFAKEVEKAKSAKGFGLAINQAAVRQRYGGGGVAQEPTRFLECVQLDDTPFPMVFVIDPVRRFPVGVATVTIALCVYTRVILGWDISFETPRHATYMRTLLHTALPKSLPAAFRSIPELSEICGKVVGHMLVDNAKHLIARSAQDAGGDVGQAVRWAGKRQPTHKAHVESCLGTLQDMIREELPAGTWDIPLMREFDYDPATQAIATIQQFRTIFAMIVAKYHTADHAGLGGRKPLDVWLEQRALHGLDMVSDPDHFERAIAKAYWVSFRGDGAEIEGPRYGGDATDDRCPLSNQDILHHLSLSRGASSDTKKRTFPNVKIKVDPDDLGRAWLFDEHLGEYVPIRCARRRYADGLPLWLHERLQAFAKSRGFAFDEERDMLTVRQKYSEMMAEVLPEAALADRNAAALLFDSAEGRAYLGDAVEVIRVAGSPSGMENTVDHELRTRIRGDAMRIAPRSSGRRGRPASDRRRKGPQIDPVDARKRDREQDVSYATRRLDVGWSDEGYQ